MPVRDFTPALLWLCATVLLHFGAAFAGAPGSTLPDTPPSILTPDPTQAPPSQNGSVRAGPDTNSSALQESIPASARNTLKALEARHGDPLPGYVGGRTFQNRERVLPRGRYREYDVHPRVPGRSRGSERIVVDRRTGKAYYTADHYRSFTPMN